MKKFIIVIITLIIVIILAPYFIGSSAETQIREQVTKVDAHPSYQLSLLNYDKGWFHSKAEFELSILMPEEMTEVISLDKIKIIQEIQHGPVLWQGEELAIGLMDSEIAFQLANAILANLKRVAGLNEKILSITSRTNFDSATSIYFGLNAFAIQEGLNTIKVKEGHGNFSYAMNGHIEGNLNWQGLSVNTQEMETLRVGTLTIDTSQDLVSGEMFSPSALFDGYFTSKISTINMSGKVPQENISLQNLHLSLTSDIKADLANVAMVAGAKKILAIDQEFKELIFDMSFESLDIESLKAINQIAIDSQGQDPLLMAAQFQGVLPQLIEKGPVLKINKLAVATKNGDINSDLNISIDKTIYDKNNPMTMMLALVANAKGQAPEAFFNDLGAADAIESMLQRNLLIRDQQNLKFAFTFNNGQALLNGQPIPLAGM